MSVWPAFEETLHFWRAKRETSRATCGFTGSLLLWVTTSDFSWLSQVESLLEASATSRQSPPLEKLRETKLWITRNYLFLLSKKFCNILRVTINTIWGLQRRRSGWSPGLHFIFLIKEWSKCIPCILYLTYIKTLANPTYYTQRIIT